MTHTASGSTTSPPGAGAGAVAPDLVADVQRIFADVTRYPIEILEPEASIEEDLGIDSVKLGEIIAALRAKYNLPAANEMQGRVGPERVRTIATVAALVAEMAAPVPDQQAAAARPSGARRTPAPSPEAVSQAQAIDTTSPAAIVDEVRRVFAEITRYPPDILEPDADLEEDLGVDSVKLGEIVAALRERYKLPPQDELQGRFPPERMRTIAGIAGVIGEMVATASPRVSRARVSAAAPAVAPAAGAGAVHAERRAAPKSRELEGKIVLVTGSGRGLGKALACHLADLGATLVINSFHSRQLGEATAEEIVAAGGSAVHIWASVANEAQRNALFDEIESRFGGLDFFVSSASNGALGRVDEITPEHWEKAYRTNIVALHQGALRAARLMQPRGGGKIVTLSMTPADRYLPYAVCMGTVKAGVEALTRYLAVEFAPLQIQVNCVKAGAVYGDLVEKWPDSATLTAQWEARTPLGRLCRPEDVAAAVAVLLRGELEYMTGATILLDGGHSLRL